MKTIDKFLDLLNGARRLRIDVVAQPSDLMTQMNLIRARLFLRITGKSLGSVQPVSTSDADNITEGLGKDLSPSRRLARRQL
ncbi:MAG: hypothetical protein C4K49_09245 [Candidatus Thorarchaeota archaeon]|nr:MAG: hypothetical protein C4K49_09245 [Candidatus Thorarchaeota archaeon]